MVGERLDPAVQLRKLPARQNSAADCAQAAPALTPIGRLWSEAHVYIRRKAHLMRGIVLAMAAYETPEWHPAFEEYCETIFELGEDDVVVKQARIAERLGVSRPAVSEMVHRLQTEGLVIGRAGTVKLSASGKRLAERVVRRHRVAERFLTDILGISSPDAHHEAGKWEHVLSEKVEAAMLKLLGDPTTCPHGNPIPGSGYKAPATTPLASLATGSAFTVSRIPEELEFAPGLLEFLEESGIALGVKGTVTASSPDGTRTIEIAGNRVGVGAFASERILTTSKD